jgi:hypothetical protein
MSDQGEGGRAPLRGDEAEPFRDFDRLFVRTVLLRTNAPAASAAANPLSTFIGFFLPPLCRASGEG